MWSTLQLNYGDRWGRVAKIEEKLLEGNNDTMEIVTVGIFIYALLNKVYPI